MRGSNSSINTGEREGTSREGTSIKVDDKHVFEHGNKIYHIAIIDYLQEWNTDKKLERFTKTMILGKNSEQLSAIEPNAYARRFEHFVSNHVIV